MQSLGCVFFMITVKYLRCLIICGFSWQQLNPVKHLMKLVMHYICRVGLEMQI